MKKRLLIVSCIAVLLVALATMSFAENPVKLVVNGTEMKPDVPPQIINGRTMVPIRFIAELFDTEVNWDQENQTVSIYKRSDRGHMLDILKQRIQELEKAIAPKTPQEAVQTWARGVEMRNNSLQYAVLSPEYREQGFGGGSEYHPIGVEAQPPGLWVNDFRIIKETKADEGAREYDVQFQVANSTGNVGTYTSKVFIKQFDQKWFVTNISSDSVAEQLQLEIKDYQTDRYKKIGLQKLEVSLLSLSIYNKHAVAYYKTEVTHNFDYKYAAEWPEQKGRIRYLEVNRQNLSPEQIRNIQDKIDFYAKELQKNIESHTRTVDVYFFIRVDLDEMNRIIKERLLLHTQNPRNPEDYTGVSSHPLEEDLVGRGYAEMLQLVEQY